MKFIKNLHVVALVAAMMALGARAATVSSEQVLNAVSAWASANGAAFAGSGAAESAMPTYDDDGTTVLYWTVTMSNGGAVIASPDTDLDLVVAVLEKYDGAFPAGHPLPSILKADLRNRLSVIAGRGKLSGDNSGFSTGGGRVAAPAGQSSSQTGSDGGDAAVPDDVKASMSEANAQWAKYGVRSGRPRLRADSLADGDASPYVRRIVDGFESNGRFTHWNQGDYRQRPYIYNYHTPNNEVCGCVATAGAAILQFFNCTNDVGSVKSLVEGGCQLYGASYDCNTKPGVLDWAALPTAYGGESTAALDDAGRELMGRATYNVGVLVGMSWASDGRGSESGAYISNLVKVFKEYGFNTSRYVGYSGNPTTNGKEFMKTLYAQMWCGAPVVLSISGAPGGHAVVGCGYARDSDGDEFCRVFMGWGGSGDNWYKFPAVYSFSQVNGAVTMIGYENDAVVPVYGETNLMAVNNELSIPGYMTNDVQVFVEVDAHGFFGIRVPLSLAPASRFIDHTGRGKRFAITPFDDSVLGKEDAKRDDLDKALPDEMMLMILNMDVRTSAAVGRAVASRDDKALLMVSGTPGSDRTVALLNYLYYLDETTDISNKFVLVFTSTSSPDVTGVDGDPSIGVFDPDIGSADLRWWVMNGRLSYTNFIVSADYQTGEIVYEITATDTSAVTNALPMLMEDGYTIYLRNHSDAVVTVTGVDLGSWSNAPFDPFVGNGGIGGTSPAYGVISNAWTNCESVVFSAPGTITNMSEGVIYSCIGWATNEVFVSTNEPAFKAGNKARLSLSPGDRVNFTWVWQKTHFLVTASTGGLPSYLLVGMPQYVSPTNAWCAVGDRVTIQAVATVEDYKLWQWSAHGKCGDYFSFYDGISTNDAMRSENGTALSFTVYEPVEVTAKYRLTGGVKSDPVATTVTVTSEPAEIAGFATLSGSLNWGVNTIYDSVVHLAPGAGAHIDSTGGVWVCSGWIIDGEPIAGESVDIDLGWLGGSMDVVSVWQYQGTAPSGDQEEETEPTPGPISIKSISRSTTGVWVITVSGGVKDCWYWLYSATDVGDFAGSEATWKTVAGPAALTEGANPQKAAADGDIVFHAAGGGTAKFWRARATSKGDDN